jgi:hypothetical protein
MTLTVDDIDIIIYIIKNNKIPDERFISLLYTPYDKKRMNNLNKVLDPQNSDVKYVKIDDILPKLI